MADRDKPPKIPAAGALLWRPGEQGPEVVLVHRPRYDDWSFPKGKCLPGEHVLITAVREVAEETEIEIILGRKLRTVRYLSDGRPKQVDYWAARVKAGTILFEIAGVPEASAKKALVRVAMKMPVRCRFVGRRLSV